MLGPSGPLRAVIPRPGATPAALRLQRGLRCAWAAGRWEVSRPYLAARCRAAAKSAPQCGSGMVGVPVLTTGERRMLAASEVSGGDCDDGEVRNLTSSGVEVTDPRWFL